MKISRGDIADRFDRIKQTYLDVTRSTRDQVERETVILDAYRDFRGALKQAEVMALEVLRSAEQKLAAAKAELESASKVVSDFQGTDPAERARSELIRDEHLRRTQDEEKRYQIAKDLSDNLTSAITPRRSSWRASSRQRTRRSASMRRRSPSSPPMTLF